MYSLAGAEAKYSRVVRYGSFSVLSSGSAPADSGDVVEVLSSSYGYPSKDVEWHRHWAGKCWPEVVYDYESQERYHAGFRPKLRFSRTTTSGNATYYVYDVLTGDGSPLSSKETWLEDYSVHTHGQPAHRIIHSASAKDASYSGTSVQPLQLSYQGRSKSVSVDLPAGDVYVKIDWNARRYRAKKLLMYCDYYDYPMYLDVPLTGGGVSATYEQKSAFGLPSTSADVWELSAWYEDHSGMQDVYHRVYCPLSTECDVNEYYDRYEEASGAMWIRAGSASGNNRDPGDMFNERFWKGDSSSGFDGSGDVGRSGLLWVLDVVGRKILNDQWPDVGPRDWVDIYAEVPELGGAAIVYQPVRPTY